MTNQRGTTSQLHSKTPSYLYRPNPSRRPHLDSNPSEIAAGRVETRSQRGRPGATPSHHRIKTVSRTAFEELLSSGTDAHVLPMGRGRPPQRIPAPARATTFDPSPYHPFPPGIRPRGTAPIYLPSPFPSHQLPPGFASSAPTAGSIFFSASHMMGHHSNVSLSTQEKNKLKEWIQTQARHFRSTYFSENSSTSNVALEIIRRLASAVDLLHVGKEPHENHQALHDIAQILAKGDVSPFEMVHSSLITKLYQYLTDDISIPNDRNQRLKLFLHVFTQLPNDSNDQNLKDFLFKLHQHRLNHEKSSATTILNHLINKLHGCINQLEQFPIRGQ